MEKAIGIDLGGTSIYGGIVNKKGEILKKAERATPLDKGKREVLDKILEVIDELMEEGILGIGIGSPGTIDPENGKVLEIGGNIKDWAHTDIKGEITTALKRTYGDGSSLSWPNSTKEPSPCVVKVENDANVAALCEAWIGAGKEMKSFIMLTLGTGLGGAIYRQKEGLLRGHSFQGAELGHAILYPKGRPCLCGQAGCAEKYISGDAVEKIYFEATGEKRRGKEIFRLSLKNPIANNIIEEYIENLAIYLVSLKNILDPQGIIIGGGVINSRHIWWDKMINYYKHHTNTPDTTEIVPAIHLNNAGMIGAARLVLNNSL